MISENASLIFPILDSICDIQKQLIITPVLGI